jgi:signal transduction histidine kinase
VRMELSKLERENAHMREEIVKDKESAAKQLARCEADANEVIQQLRRTVVQLEGQLKQQVCFNSWARICVQRVSLLGFIHFCLGN